MSALLARWAAAAAGGLALLHRWPTSERSHIMADFEKVISFIPDCSSGSCRDSVIFFLADHSNKR